MASDNPRHWIYGLAAIDAYLEVSPNINLTILEADSRIGGTWRATCVSPEYIVDSPIPAFEFGNISTMEQFGARVCSNIVGELVTQYLDLYTQKFGILENGRFNADI